MNYTELPHYIYSTIFTSLKYNTVFSIAVSSQSSFKSKSCDFSMAEGCHFNGKKNAIGTIEYEIYLTVLFGNKAVEKF